MSEMQRGRLAILPILVALPCLGLACGFGVYQWLISARHWQTLGAPPEKAVAIVTGNRDTLYVQTDTGRLYACTNTSTDAPENCWRESPPPEPSNRFVRFDENLDAFVTRAPPGKVVDTLDVTINMADFPLRTRYVLLEDGTLWWWDYDGPRWDDLIGLCLSGGGLAAGGALAAVVAVIRRLRRRDRAPAISAG